MFGGLSGSAPPIPDQEICLIRVTLRPVDESDLAVFDRELHSPEGRRDFQWFGFRSGLHDGQALEANGLIGRAPSAAPRRRNSSSSANCRLKRSSPPRGTPVRPIREFVNRPDRESSRREFGLGFLLAVNQ